MISTNAIISLIIWFAKFTDLIRDVTEIRRISCGYPPSGLQVPEVGCQGSQIFIINFSLNTIEEVHRKLYNVWSLDLSF